MLAHLQDRTHVSITIVSVLFGFTEIGCADFWFWHKWDICGSHNVCDKALLPFSSLLALLQQIHSGLCCCSSSCSAHCSHEPSLSGWSARHTAAPHANIAAARCTSTLEEGLCALPCWLWVRRSCAPLGRCRWRCSPAPSVVWLRPGLWWTSGGPDSKAWVLRSYWQAGWTAEQLHSAHLSGMDTPGRGVQVRHWDTSSDTVIKSSKDMRKK